MTGPEVAFGDDFSPRARQGIEAVELDAELVLYDPTHDRFHHLDRVGSIIWPLLDGRVTVAELIADLTYEFAADPPRVRDDLMAMLQALHERNLLENTET